jgi:hypothetical protein
MDAGGHDATLTILFHPVNDPRDGSVYPVDLVNTINCNLGRETSAYC